MGEMWLAKTWYVNILVQHILVYINISDFAKELKYWVKIWGLSINIKLHIILASLANTPHTNSCSSLNIQTWLICPKIASDSGNLLIENQVCSMYIEGVTAIYVRHVSQYGQIFVCDPSNFQSNLSASECIRCLSVTLKVFRNICDTLTGDQWQWWRPIR